VDSDVPARETEAGREAERAAEAAEEERALEGEDVTYAQILADPDNVDLNYRYAQAQIRRGDVRGAGATLERILLMHPGLPRIRLLYAIVLYRLDNLDEAERELRAVRDFEMPESLRADIDRYLALIALRRKTTRMSLYTSFGYQYDNNRNAAPASKRALVSDLPAVVSGASARQDDLAAVGLARFALRHDLGFQARHELTGALTYYHGEQTQQDRFDLQALTAELGGVYDATPFTFTPNIYYRRVNLSRENFLHAQGAELEAAYQATKSIGLHLRGRLEDQKFRGISENPTAFERQGPEWLGAAGAEAVLGPTMRIEAEFRLLLKEAREKYNGYLEKSLHLDHIWLLGGGHYLLTSLSAAIDLYDDPDPFVSAATRRDEQYRARFTYGLPLSWLAGGEGAVAEALRGFNLNNTYEVYRSSSNLTNFTYWNRRYSISVSRRWEF